MFYKPFNINDIDKWLNECELNIDFVRVLYSWT